MKLKSLLIAACVFMCSFSQLQAAQHWLVVSILNLITSPTEYVDREIAVRGFLIQQVDLRLYPNQIWADMLDHSSSIPVVDLTPALEIAKSCNMKYVRIRGRFANYKNQRYEIADVARIREIKSGSVCWENKKKR